MNASNEQEYDNPAKRLHSVLTKMKAVHQTSAQFSNVFSEKILEINASEANPGMLLDSIRLLLQAVHETKIVISSHPDLNKELYLKHLIQIENGFCQLNLLGAWNEYVSKFPATAIVGLEIIADLIKNGTGMKEIPKDNLKEIKDDINNLFEKAKSSISDIYFRQFLLKHISFLRAAIDQYDIYGPTGIKDALAQFYGAYALETCCFGEKGKNDQQEKEKKTFGETLLSTLKKIHDALVFIKDGNEVRVLASPAFVSISHQISAILD